MVYCLATHCKSSHGENKGFFLFPSDPHRRKLWVTKVNRQGFKPGQLWKPSQHSRLCSDHFEDSAFVVPPKMALSMGFDIKRLRLKPDAIPTIFTRHDPEPVPNPHRYGAFKKRRKMEVRPKRNVSGYFRPPNFSISCPLLEVLCQVPQGILVCSSPSCFLIQVWLCFYCQQQHNG